MDRATPADVTAALDAGLVWELTGDAVAPETAAGVLRGLLATDSDLLAAGALDPPLLAHFERLLAWEAERDAPPPPAPRGRRARPPASRRPKRRDAAPVAPVAPVPPEPLEIHGYEDLSPLIRGRAGRPRCDHPDYLQPVAAALALLLDGRKPTASAVQGLIDRWKGVAPGVSTKSDSQRAHAWFTHFHATRTGQDLEARTGRRLVFSDAVADARALQAATQAIRDRRWRTGSHKRVTK